MDVEIKGQVKAKFEAYLIKNKLRKTPERFAILNHIYSIKGRFEMDSLYVSINEGSYKISKATLYNTIELLLDCNLVVKYQLGSHASQYERAIGKSNFDYLICLNCGSVKEYKKGSLFTPTQQKKIRTFKIMYYSMYIYGLCNKCSKQKENQEKTNKKNTSKKK